MVNYYWPRANIWFSCLPELINKFFPSMAVLICSVWVNIREVLYSPQTLTNLHLVWKCMWQVMHWESLANYQWMFSCHQGLNAWMLHIEDIRGVRIWIDLCQPDVKLPNISIQVSSWPRVLLSQNLKSLSVTTIITLGPYSQRNTYLHYHNCPHMSHQMPIFSDICPLWFLSNHKYSKPNIQRRE